MKDYEAPKIKVVELETEDVIASSGLIPGGNASVPGPGVIVPTPGQTSTTSLESEY